MDSVRIEQRDTVLVTGIQVATSNAEESDPAKARIPDLWQRVFAEGIAGRIRHRVDESTFAVYYDYESDRNSPYTLTVGCAISSSDGQPEDIATVNFPAQRSAVVTTERGSMPSIVIEAWQCIWSATPAGLGGRRAFVADFEIYEGRGANPADAQVEIWVGLEG